MKKNKSGVQFSDRELAGQVRNLALDHLYKILQPDYQDKEYQKALLLKIASSLLPRQQEHTGADGKDLPPLLVKFVDNDSGNTSWV